MVVPGRAVRTMELLSTRHLLRQQTGLPETVGQAIREYLHGDLDLVVFNESTDPDCGWASARVSTIPLEIEKASHRWSGAAVTNFSHFKCALRGPHVMSRHVVKWASFDRSSDEHGFRICGRVEDEESDAGEEEPAHWCISISHAAAPSISAERSPRNVQVDYTREVEGQVDAGVLFKRSGRSLCLRVGHVAVSSGWQWAAAASQSEWDIYDIIDVVVFDTSSGEALHTEHIHCVPSSKSAEHIVSMSAEHDWLAIQSGSHICILKRSADHGSFHRVHVFDQSECYAASLSAQIILHNERALIRSGNAVESVRLENWVKEWTMQKSHPITSVSCSQGVVAVAAACATRTWSNCHTLLEITTPTRHPFATIDLLDAGSGVCFQRVNLLQMGWGKPFPHQGLQIALKDHRSKLGAVAEHALRQHHLGTSQVAMFEQRSR